jgi:hypothetical protein
MAGIPEGPWQKLGAGAAVVAVVLALYFGFRSSPSPTHPPASSSGHSAIPPISTTPGTGKSSTPVGLSRPVYLDTLPETTGDQVTPGQVSIGGRTYQHGLQFSVTLIFSVVSASYSIPPGARTFTAVIGNDDNQPNPFWDGISLFFEVFVDGRRVASGHARGHVQDSPIHAQVTGGSTITLQVTNINGAGGGTNADWGNPVFH